MKNALPLLFTMGLTFPLLGIAQTPKTELQQILDSAYLSHPDAVGILVHVESPDHNISWSGAAGHSDKSEGEILANQPVLIASNTKTYVAAAILKLVELEKFKLDDPIHDLILDDTESVLLEDGYNPMEITIRHLLSHTSGIADYVDDAYVAFVNEQPNHLWSREEQIRRTVLVGDPLAKPGEKFSYGDINYLLLTEIIERSTAEPFFLAMRELLGYQKHQLHATWFIDLEEAPKDIKPLAHQYWNKYNWDSQEINPSWDLYGGGGIVSTTKDAARFFQLLFEGKIIENKELLAQLYTYVLPEEESNYCLGLRHIPFHGTSAYYHGGFWGTDVIHLPEYNTSIAIFTLQKDQRELSLEMNKKIFDLIKSM